MDLMCNEKEMFKDQHIDNQMQHVMHIEPQVNTALADPTFLSERCLENLLKSEETHPVINFYNNPQCEITPKMRRIVAEWMMEVSLRWFLSFYHHFSLNSFFEFNFKQKKMFTYYAIAFRDTWNILTVFISPFFLFSIRMTNVTQILELYYFRLYLCSIFPIKRKFAAFYNFFCLFRLFFNICLFHSFSSI